MECPCCGEGMEEQRLQDRQGVAIPIDICTRCQVLWFDPYEDLRLSPASTLGVFQVIAKQAQAPAPPTSDAPACPRCGLRLLETHDQQHLTRFEYLRCGRGHGRLVTFVNFLLEKDFIRPLSREEIDELQKRSIQAITCSKCGAAVDLGRGATCAHCGASLSMLDVSRMTNLIGS